MDKIQIIKNRGLKEYNNYIEQIRFPFFKKISRNQKIDFDFPFTALVGPNGSGKSSALQALYGACSGKSVSDFWFSTKIDPIRGTKNEINRFIYKFKPQGFKRSVEVLNQRTTKKDDPDYWETQSPTKRDNMEPMPTMVPTDAPFRSKTRWNPIDKEVTYIDFRSELSAFDKCFYFGHFEKSDSIKSIKDFLRVRSSSLKKIIDSGCDEGRWYGKRVTNAYELKEEALNWSNRILGKKYESAKIIEHDLFNQKGISIIFNSGGHKYSEAVAGSGEVAVVTSVINILEATPHSLILLDEPEVSLHPGAQLSLRALLLEKILKDYCQVVVSTHSETFLKQLPNDAIKLFYLDEANNTYSVAPESTAEQAFYRLGGKTEGQNKLLYVEDDLAKILVEEAVKEIDPEIINDILIIPHPGGAKSIIKNLGVNFAIAKPDLKSHIVLLDGDQKINVEKITAGDIPENNHNQINQILCEQTGINGKKFILPLDGGNAGDKAKEAQRTAILLDVLDAYHNYFNFMNTNTPEELIWEIASHSSRMTALCEQINVDCYKNKFEELASSMLEKKDSESLLTVQRIMLVARDCEHQYWVDFKALLQRILNISPMK